MRPSHSSYAQANRHSLDSPRLFTPVSTSTSHHLHHSHSISPKPLNQPRPPSRQPSHDGLGTIVPNWTAYQNHQISTIHTRSRPVPLPPPKKPRRVRQMKKIEESVRTPPHRPLTPQPNLNMHNPHHKQRSQAPIQHLPIRTIEFGHCGEDER